MSRLRQILGLVVVLAVAGFIGYAGYERFGPEPVEAVIPTTLSVERGNLIATVSATGNVEAATLSELSFRINGTLLELLVDVGTEVQAGQVLARLETSTLESTLRQARAGLRSATTEAHRASGRPPQPRTSGSVRLPSSPPS